MLKFLKNIVSELRAARGGRAQPKIWMFGPMPPPLHGQSNYNATIAAFFRTQASLTILSTGGTAAEKLVAGLILPFIALLFIGKSDKIYTSPPGQSGLWLFMPCILVFRLRGMEHVIHHHSYRPINIGPTRSNRVLTRLGGPKQRHVFLSERMREQYAAIYLSAPQKAGSFVLPNAFFFYEEQAEPQRREGPVTIGHLSVITREKGAPYLIELVEALARERRDFRFVLAGPVRDPALKAEIDAFCKRNEGIASHIGPVMGQDKRQFYQSVDLFVLPTRLIDEADPLVLLEAYSFGCDVLASSTGCIPERVRSPDRLLTFDLAQDVIRLNLAIDAAQQNRAETSIACMAFVKDLYERSRADAERFFGYFGCSIHAHASDRKK
ncbi:hypothetical protein BJF92_20770 [Rhizobium rhizosphaerae]|uniref:Glycosyltransferase n=1 Tax=Xaviernesmea rhizosphaerae TaxID=1672749 RepID=A0A1Q9ACW7_9HYPH|nr:glycosyltransferase family 4 protein [Xaviernesmea rhizosphaerae]OLP52756.1 hypothetical protein BJF92_20770 [Xaviernesmea rhizosphaerae]